MLAVVGLSTAHSAIVLSGTRVIFDTQSGEKTLRLTNKGNTPSLVQSWLDAGDSQIDRATLALPFIVSPPMARIDPSKSQTLRIIHTGESLPQNQESLFWLNVLEVPPRPELGNTQNFLQLSLRTRIKLLYRPSGLEGTATEAPNRITWTLATEAGRTVLQASNPTPYHVSLSAIDLNNGDQILSVQRVSTINPFETRAFALPKNAAVYPSTLVRYQFVNDYGGVGSGEAKLRNASR